MNNNRVKYIVVKDKGIVRAVISDCKFDALFAFNKKFMFPSTTCLTMDIAFGHESDEKFTMPHQFSAVARCHAEDEWDEEIGKKIALKKLSEKYNKSLDKHLANMFDTMISVMDKMSVYLGDRNLLD